ncbi:MAG: FAD-dependent oxidoreductase [Planctomycetales bacterium]|nr:FAD-dependent oxidoreductase [Planctomycetales bacterium]
MFRPGLYVFLVVLPFRTVTAAPSDSERTFDVVIYGGTSAAVTAAVQVSRMDRSVAIVCPDVHPGGLSASGLGYTDTGNKSVIGGLAREFYHRVWQHYQDDSAWTWQPRSEYGNKGQGTPAMDGKLRTMWIFEPHVAEQVFNDLIAEHDIPVFRDEWLDRESGVTKEGRRITSIRMLSGMTIRGTVFIDATYEGDLMAAAGVDYHVGREPKSQYGEEWNGIQTGVLHHGHHFGVLPDPVSPYVIPGDPSSGLLPRISPDPPGNYGEGDKRVQAYCYRMCLTNDERNRRSFPKPEGYDARQYELLLRVLNAGWREGFQKFDPIPNHKTDTNNHGPMSTDNIGMNYEYPEASYEKRRAIIREHEIYQQGWLYFIANDPRVPNDVQEEMRRWGLPKDEFTGNGHWSHQLYIREARRMVGQYVMTENELLKRRDTPDSVGMGSYTMDSHNVQRYITPEGFVQNEGDIGVSTRGPYQIAYGSLIPKRGQATNLLVPVCVSSSHIAFGSIRMEPVFMILGQSAATAAVLAIDAGQAVQDVDYDALRKRLLADGQVLDAPAGSAAKPAKSIRAKDLKGIVVDDSQAKATGLWQQSGSVGPFVGLGYSHDGNEGKGKSEMRFDIPIPKSGRYEVRFAYTASSNRASNVPVIVEHAGGVASSKIDERAAPPIDGLFISLGTYSFDSESGAMVTVHNDATNGHVIVDAVQLVPAQ